ncbi:MAG: aspartate kinase [Bacillaceae bacterium]|nr:aspartate kinase [Bacillaceae bacterium]
MSIVVQKYGGTSVGSVERIQHVARRVVQAREAGHDCVVVVSAMGKSTDKLVDMAKEICPYPDEREMDMLLTTGEQVSIALLTMALHQLGHKAVSMTGWQAGILTEPVHGSARIKKINPEPVLNELKQGKIVVVAGFQGWTEDRQITTLGRGGSDTTAVALAASLNAERCEIYTDVTGVYTADPRIVPQARKLKSISYDEMLELANLGAGVLHPRAVETAKNHDVKLVVCSSFVDEPGTKVEEESNMEQGLVVSGVAHDKDIAKITVTKMPNRVGTLSKLFTTLAENHINVDIIIQSTYVADTTNISFSVSGNDLKKTLEVLENNKDKLSYEEVLHEDGLAKVSIVGAGMISNPGVAARMFHELSEADVPIHMVSTSEIKVSCVIPAGKTEEAVNALHTAFGLNAEDQAVVHGS